MIFRGIIIEIKDKYSIVMKDNGSMVRIKNKEGLKIGDAILFLEEDIYMKNNVINFTNFKVWKPMIAVAACLMLVLLFAYNRNPYTDYAVLSMDVNPSVQLKLDKHGNIIDILGVNIDGENILDKHLVGKPLEEGLSTLKLLMEEKNYLKDDSPILIGFAYLEDIKDEKYEENIKSLLKKIYSKNEILYLKSNFVKANESLKNKLSLGRLEALESITDENIKANIDSITVKEIKDNILKSNRVELFNDDDMDEDDDDDEEDNDHKLEDKTDKENNNKDNEEIDDDKNENDEKDDSTNTFINKDSNDDKIESNKNDDDHDDDSDNKSDDDYDDDVDSKNDDDHDDDVESKNDDADNKGDDDYEEDDDENDSSTNTNTFINKKYNDDNVESNKGDDDYEDSVDNKSNDNYEDDDSDSSSNTNNSSDDDGDD